MKKKKLYRVKTKYSVTDKKGEIFQVKKNKIILCVDYKKVSSTEYEIVFLIDGKLFSNFYDLLDENYLFIELKK